MEGARPLPFFFQKEEDVSAAPPIAEPVWKAGSESLMVDEHDRSTKLEDLNLEDWPLEDSFKLVSDFLDSMPGNSRVTEPEMNLRASSPSSVSSSRMSFLHETSFRTCQAVNQKLETLEQQIDELSILLTQRGREKLLARALAQLQWISVVAHFESATINIPNDSDVEPMTPPTKDMGVDPMFLDSTTMGIADTLPNYHLADYGLLEGNPCTSDTEETDNNLTLHFIIEGGEGGYPQLQILALQVCAERGFYLPMLC